MTNADDWLRTLRAGAAVGAALVIEHQLFYDADAYAREPELVLFASNALGTATIAAGVALAAHDAGEVARHLTIAALGGATVLFIRLIRRELRMRGDSQYYAGHAAGQIEGIETHDQAYRRAVARNG